MTNNTPADWCDYESGHPAHIDFRAFHERYCPGDLEPQSPLWCPILVPHDAHRAQNQFGGWNECSGKKLPVRIGPVEDVNPNSEYVLKNVQLLGDRFREIQESHERDLEEAFNRGGLREVYRLGINANPLKHLRRDYKNAVFPLAYGVGGGPVPTFAEWLATALSHISTRATAEYAEHVETVRRSESQRLYGHTGASAGVGQTEEGRTEALREAFLKFLSPTDDIDAGHFKAPEAP